MEEQERIFLNSVFFVIGFVIVFSIIGTVLQLLLSALALAVMNVLRIIGGLIIIFFGILLLLSDKYLIPFFSKVYMPRFTRSSNSFISSFVLGIAFAICWTPCVGPILGSIYVLALTSPGFGFFMLFAYSLGLGVPFLIFGAFISRLTGFMKRISRFLRYFNIIGGLFLIAVGILLITGYIGLLSIFLVGANTYISISGSLNFLIAFTAGVLTFLSPCILPLVPAYLSYVGAKSIVGYK